MIADGVISAVTQTTDWVNSIVCNIRETPEGKRKIRFCLDPKELNKNIRREHYSTPTPSMNSCRSYMVRSSFPWSTRRKVIAMWP